MRTLTLLLPFLITPAFAFYPTDFDEPLETITFGSCNRADLPQPLWEEMDEPDLFVWLGDNVYADTEDMAVMRAKYQKQFERPEYAAFREEVAILGIWDDHDYGDNNVGIEYPKKVESQKELLDFLETPADSPRRTQEGIYTSYVFGPEGQQVNMILLDTRYFAEVEKAVAQDPSADILGEAQWAWLEETLRTTTAQVNVIASGIQVLAPNHRFEKWGNYPQAKQRLLDLIAEHQVPGVIFISGDRHVGEVTLLNTPQTPYPIIEVTSSSLTHSWSGIPGERNDFRMGPLVREENFGLIELDWEEGEIELSLQTEEGEAMSLEMPLTALQPLKDRGF